MHYPLVEPEYFTDVHRRYIEHFSHAVDLASSCSSDTIVGAKDVHSRHLTASDPYARITGLSFGKDVAGRMDGDMPWQTWQ